MPCFRSAYLGKPGNSLFLVFALEFVSPNWI